ncbi:MarR family winged helix-turn-helix transcriptional regulator [Paenibacillus radicis (ex Gao et al. 2016)]|uniref:MarR family transcriptional regulator n=1 Tax=Paenibacillus radicis (ex Gao et al. 2016) TaxID=1737354 RepID=A0A917HAX4_9BACL|nr:MarR family transcriptional regulator [Paenibacillus radicis (ex Gao et al. 2016)]GGG73239.1 MarR family transcriptional regulator [Paenibacillus radicis (ex Gao et al. 2016)]
MNDKDELLKLENQLCFAFYACSREITKLYRPILSELDLTYTQYITMLALWEKDGVTVKDLGARLLLDSGTLTPLLKKLEAMQLITRDRDKADERNLVIRVTEHGAQLKEKAMCVPAQLSQQMNIPIEEVNSIRDQIQDLLSKLEPTV